MDPVEFIKCELVPKLVRNGKLSSQIDVAIKSCEASKLGEDGTFMRTQCYRVKVELLGVKSGITEKVSLVIKLTPPNIPTEFYEGGNYAQLFENECTTYQKILPLLQDLEIYYPKCFYSSLTPRKEIIVLSDFTQDGWSIAKPVTNLSLENILASVKLLGKFHGYSYGIKETNPELFSDIRKQLKLTSFNADTSGNDIWDILMTKSIGRGTNSIRETEEDRNSIPEEFLDDLEKYLENPMRVQRILNEPIEPLAVLCHGDFLSNNIAFKKNGTSTVMAMMFDFQTLRYSSPMVDLATFIANSTGVDIRKPHFDDIFGAYHTELVKALCEKWNKNEDELPSHYSYDNFLKEYAKYLPFGYSIAASFVPILHCPLADPIAEMKDFSAENENLDEFIAKNLVLGGETVNREFRSLIVDMYHLEKKTGIAIIK
uniref:Putative juvenile hormone-inducible protein n=1 Tax=Nyssomyia neivai TaxID=330878 RepID=A0A1L8DNC3_9DIPT